MTSAVRPDDPVIEILTVCTGNIARSPFAEALLQSAAKRHLGEDAPVWVRSAGIHAVEGAPAVSAIQRTANGLGLDLSRHVGTQVDADVVRSCDLVLTMTESQRRRVLATAPASVGRVFTLAEFSRLVASIKPFRSGETPRDHARTLVRIAHGARPYATPPGQPEDVRDPYREPLEVYAAVTQRISTLVEAIEQPLFSDLWGL